MKLACWLLLGSALPLSAQIFADFAVAQGATPLGAFRVRLDHDKAPRTCANFIGLATGRRPWVDVATGAIKTNTPYYDGLTFHRLIHNFMIQGGSPNGQGTDGPGYAILDEYHASLRHSGRYVISMAKSSLPNTGGSQFFITLTATPHLDDKHSVFGEVIEGREIIDAFANAQTFPTTTGDRPATPIVMTSVTISGPDAENFDIDDPALKLPVIRDVVMRPSRDVAANSFSTAFSRQALHEYFNSYSTDLQAWTPFRYNLSCDPDPAAQFLTTGVTMPAFFMRMVDVDYGFLINPENVNQSGRVLRITSRAGDWIEMTLNGSAGGSWTASNGAAGALSNVTFSDAAPATGMYTNASSQVGYVPLMSLNATFAATSGVAPWTSISNLVMSFHTVNSGWVEGAANTPSGTVSVNQAFVLTP